MLKFMCLGHRKTAMCYGPPRNNTFKMLFAYVECNVLLQNLVWFDWFETVLVRCQIEVDVWPSWISPQWRCRGSGSVRQAPHRVVSILDPQEGASLKKQASRKRGKNYAYSKSLVA